MSFWATISDIEFWTLIFIYSLLVYGETIDFYTLILYIVTSKNLFIIYRRFYGGDALGLFAIMSSVNRDGFISIFLIGVLFISLFFLPFVLARMSPAMLNKNDGSQNPCLVPHNKRKAYSLSLFRIIVTGEMKFCKCS